MIVDKLKLTTGIPIPFAAIQSTVHQPLTTEVAWVGEETFYSSLSYFYITKNQMLRSMGEKKSVAEMEVVKKDLESTTDFQILMQVVSNQPEVEMGLKVILSLIFPSYDAFEINTVEECIVLEKKNRKTIITEKDFLVLKEILSQIFCFEDPAKAKGKKDEYNPADEEAQRLLRKIQEGNRRREALKKEENPGGTSVLATYIEVISVGLGLPIKDVASQTIYQLFAQVKRFGLYSQYQQQIQVASFHGSKDIKFVDWYQPS